MPATHSTFESAQTVPSPSLSSNALAEREAWIEGFNRTVLNDDIPDRYTLPRASGLTAVYIHRYRQWLDKAEPDHHLILINRSTRGRHETYVRLTVKCKALNIKIEDEFIYNNAETLEAAKALARAERAQLSDELFCLVRRTTPEVPGIYHYPAQQCYKADITTGDKRQFKAFSYRYSPQHEVYDRAVKALFDVWAIDYPEQLFVNLGIVPRAVVEV